MNQNKLLKHAATLLALCALPASASLAAPATLRPAPSVTIEEVLPVTQKEDGYSGWSTIGQLNDDTLVVVYSGGREAHVCPYGQLRLNRSTDGGKTWSKPETPLQQHH